MQQRPELELALIARVEAELLADGEREHEHALAVLAARVGVVGLEHLAHQQRAPAVGLAELQRVFDALVALPAQRRQQGEERQHEDDRRRLGVRHERQEQPDR